MLVISCSTFDILPIDRSFNRADTVGHNRLQPSFACLFLWHLVSFRRPKSKPLSAMFPLKRGINNDGRWSTSRFPFLQFSHGGPSSGGPPSASWYQEGASRRWRWKEKDSQYALASNRGNRRLSCRTVINERERNRAREEGNIYHRIKYISSRR